MDRDRGPNDTQGNDAQGPRSSAGRTARAASFIAVVLAASVLGSGTGAWLVMRPARSPGLLAQARAIPVDAGVDADTPPGCCLPTPCPPCPAATPPAPPVATPRPHAPDERTRRPPSRSTWWRDAVAKNPYQ